MRAFFDSLCSAGIDLSACRQEEQVLSPMPDVTTAPRDFESDEFLFIASDGVWDVFTSQELCDVFTSFLWRLSEGRVLLASGRKLEGELENELMEHAMGDYYRKHFAKDVVVAAAQATIALAHLRGSTDNMVSCKRSVPCPIFDASPNAPRDGGTADTGRSGYASRTGIAKTTGARRRRGWGGRGF